MSARRLSGQGLAALASSLADLGVVSRWREKVMPVEGSECWWWTGAISGGAGTGSSTTLLAAPSSRTGSRSGRVHGVEGLAQMQVLGHRWDNPLWQRVHPESMRC